MAFDPIQEQAGMLAKTGSFWYRTITASDKQIAYKLTQLGGLTKARTQMRNAMHATLSGGYFNDYYRVIYFTDKDIAYNGTEAALQKRFREVTEYVRANNLTIEGSLITESDNVISDSGDGIVTPNPDGSITLPANYRIEFGLITDPDICVQAIEYKDGALLLNGIDFHAAYGYIAFPNNPITLFPDMKFMARHVTYRERNLLSYTLRLNNVYGPVDRVMDYYRVHQNIPALRLAAAQACGMAVTRTECTIMDIVPLHDGVSYIMDTGERYDAPYRHFHLKKLAKLPAGYIIGGRELFRLYWYGGTEDVSELPGIDPYRALPVRNIYIPNKPIPIQAGSYYRPAYEGTGVRDYYKFLAAKDGGPSSVSYDTITTTTEPVLPGNPNATGTFAGVVIYSGHVPEDYIYEITLRALNLDDTTGIGDYGDGVSQKGLYLRAVVGTSSTMTEELQYVPTTSDEVYLSTNLGYSKSGIISWNFSIPIHVEPGKFLRLDFVTDKYPNGNYSQVSYNIRADMFLHGSDSVCKTLSVIGWYSTNDNSVYVPQLSFVVSNYYTENGVTQFLDKVGPRWMVCAVNKGWMSSQMQKDLITFLDREAPLGSVLTLADLDDIISEET